MKWQPTAEYQKIAEANREYYAKTAQLYDLTETCVTDRMAQENLQSTLDRVLRECNKPLNEVYALDACGGSGNISLKLLQRGVRVLLADISPDLQAIFKKKCEQSGLRGETVCGEIATFLSATDKEFDLVIFSSALHHLQNIDEVLRLVFDHLPPGGLVFTTFDPTSRDQMSGFAKCLTNAEYYFFKIFCQTADVPKAFWRKTSRMLSGVKATRKENIAVNEATAGLLAEYHVEKGIDDVALVKRLQGMGYEIVWHDRFPSARFKITRRLLKNAGQVTSFQLLLRRPRTSDLACSDPQSLYSPKPS